MTNWNHLEGKRINGLYLGLFPYSGLVVESRVKYGGQVQHTVQLDQPIAAFGADRNRILVCETEVNRILDERDAEYERLKNETYYGA